MSAMTEANELSSLKELTGETGKGILKPNDNDVLFGRGGNINVHPGNEQFRRVVHRYKEFYSAARYKKEKRLIADGIIAIIENLNPPGRFLAKNSSTGLWHPVGYEKARNKASQALRENGSLLKSNALSENEALHAELKKCNEQEARRLAEQNDDLHHGYQASYKEYHNENTMPPVHRNTIPSKHRKENANSWDIHAFNGLGYNAPESKSYDIERRKDLKELSCSARPPKAMWNNTPESTKKGWDLIPTNLEPSLNSDCIMSPSSGEDNKDVPPVVIKNKTRQRKMWQNRVSENEMSTMFGSHTQEEMFTPGERLTSRGELTLQTIEIDDSETIGGQSLVNVFDGDSMRNREISDISMDV